MECMEKREGSRVFDSPFASVHALVSEYASSASWLIGCCWAFWQTVSLNHVAVVVHSDRMPLPPWDFSIRVSQALNEEEEKHAKLSDGDEVKRLQYVSGVIHLSFLRKTERNFLCNCSDMHYRLCSPVLCLIINVVDCICDRQTDELMTI